ncbi:unnamed protein product, partial [Rotaria sp. Silwood2]
QHQCEHEFQDMNSFSQCCEKCLDDYLMFFNGSLREACQAAFSPNLVQERRPILVYIHNDADQFKKKFCETMFNSSVIVSYLNMNYVVWSWAVDSDSQIYMLANIWKEMFSTQFIDKFSVKKCPLVIGIRRQFEYERDGLTISEYQFETFVKSNTLSRSEINANHKILSNELVIFKEKCDENEQNLSFNFVKKTRLCWDIILEIAQYLPLNDAISAFSIRIFFLLQNTQSKFQLSNPYDPFVKTILPKIKKEQIISLQSSEHRLHLGIEEDLLSKFRDVFSLSLHNLLLSYRMYTYDMEVEYKLFNELLDELKNKIKRFEIHCPGIFGNQTDVDSLKQMNKKMTSIQYFLLDIGHHSLTATNEHLQHNKPFVVFITSIGFISRMPCIRYIHLIIKNYDVEHFLDDDQWKIPVELCSSLQKIILQVLGNTFHRAWWINEVLEIQTTLRIIRPTINFQIYFS